VQSPLVIVGLGQLGSLFRDAFEAAGHEVASVTRTSDRAELGRLHPAPGLVLVTVGEDDLDACLTGLPPAWKSRVALVQNELRPGQWLQAGVNEPTVLVVWFERKQGLAPKAVRESVVFGPHADFLASSLVPLGLVTRLVDEDALAFELCLKNLYILSLNLCGLAWGGTAGALLSEHGEQFARVTHELLSIERALFGVALDERALSTELERAILADRRHATAGRSAPRRFERTLAHARQLGIEVPHLRALSATVSS